MFMHIVEKKHLMTWEETFSPKVLVSRSFKANSRTLCGSACFVKEAAVHMSALLLQRRCLMVQLQKMAKSAVYPVCFVANLVIKE